jgi:hypothetical protein
MTAAMNPGSRWCRLRRRSELVEHILFVRRVLRNVLRQHGPRWLVVGPSWSSSSVRPGWPALACDHCRPGPWSGPTDPTMLLLSHTVNQRGRHRLHTAGGSLLLGAAATPKGCCCAQSAPRAPWPIGPSRVPGPDGPSSPGGGGYAGRPHFVPGRNGRGLDRARLRSGPLLLAGSVLKRARRNCGRARDSPRLLRQLFSAGLRRRRFALARYERPRGPGPGRSVWPPAALTACCAAPKLRGARGAVRAGRSGVAQHAATGGAHPDALRQLPDARGAPPPGRRGPGGGSNRTGAGGVAAGLRGPASCSDPNPREHGPSHRCQPPGPVRPGLRVLRAPFPRPSPALLLAARFIERPLHPALCPRSPRSPSPSPVAVAGCRAGAGAELVLLVLLGLLIPGLELLLLLPVATRIAKPGPACKPAWPTGVASYPSHIPPLHPCTH